MRTLNLFLMLFLSVGAYSCLDEYVIDLDQPFFVMSEEVITKEDGVHHYYKISNELNYYAGSFGETGNGSSVDYFYIESTVDVANAGDRINGIDFMRNIWSKEKAFGVQNNQDTHQNLNNNITINVADDLYRSLSNFRSKFKDTDVFGGDTIKFYHYDLR